MTTIIVPEHFDEFADADALMKACKGWGTDEKGLIEVLGHRNAAQRTLIKETYQKVYTETLQKRLQDELSGDFERAVYRWMLEPFEREAVLAYVALSKGDYRTIIELSCTPTAEEWLAVKRAYQARYSHSLEEDVACSFSGDMRKLLVLLVSVHRHESEVTDPKLTEPEALILHENIKEKKFNHEEILRILTTRSKSQLNATFYHFRDAYGSPITKCLAGHEDQDYVSALHAVISCIRSPQKYLERVLSHSMHSDKDALTRVVVTRAEKDLAVIAEMYYKRNSVTLEDAIKRETRGDYQRFLLTLLGKLQHH